ncbi:hypothetical protein ABTK41_19580, partial [Acinetobacter baumannii]
QAARLARSAADRRGHGIVAQRIGGAAYRCHARRHADGRGGGMRGGLRVLAAAGGVAVAGSAAVQLPAVCDGGGGRLHLWGGAVRLDVSG